ncbi:phenylacetate--CoA ligase family protein [Pelagibius sp.]|uniref:phenylacetate--CoA ligase family protein n=1 Tax=Pelagibius sp. TaxID=1931238 RepID=UPI003B5046B9
MAQERVGVPRSSTPGIVSPAIPGRMASLLLSVLYQFDQTQWLTAEELFAHQARQLRLLFSHAARTVPFYGRRFAEAGVDPEAEVTRSTLERLPILRRADLQAAGEAITTTTLPRSHGKMHQIETAGSTGPALRLSGTEVTKVLWRACVIREHLWHGRDLGGRLAAIRWTRQGVAMPPEGAHGDSWGPASGAVYPTGPAALLNVISELPDQAAWLTKEAPDYLISLPSNLMALAGHCIARGIRLPQLKQVMSVGEPVNDQTRRLVREAWGVPLKDSYNSEEAGYLAIQCPLHDVHHIQCENVFVEVVDEEGRACGPGEVGRVVVTPLHNFATPLVRYDLGDYAEVGAPCACGRGLPVLTRILGRRRNRLRLPGGAAVFPDFGDHRAYQAIANAVQRLRFVQRSIDEIECLMTVSAPLVPEQEEQLRALVLRNLGHPFRVTFTSLDEMPPGPRGKSEVFMSEVAG